jgi:hypothetical protein
MGASFGYISDHWTVGQDQPSITVGVTYPLHLPRLLILQIKLQVMLPRRHPISDNLHGQRRVVLRHGRIRSHRLVLPVHEHPQPSVAFRHAELLQQLLLELDKGLRFEHARGEDVRDGPVAVLEGSEVEALVFAEDLVRDDLCPSVNSSYSPRLGSPWPSGRGAARPSRAS